MLYYPKIPVWPTTIYTTSVRVFVLVLVAAQNKYIA